jgi:hypothetical protein
VLDRVFSFDARRPYFQLYDAMEPLTALSLAGTIVQFVDFGTKLFSESREIYQSSSGRLKVEDDLELVATDLTAVIRKIRRSIPSHLPEISGDIDQETQNHEKRFETICDDAAKIAEKILASIPVDQMKQKGTRNRKWKTFRQVMVRIWSRTEIDDLKKRLITLREAMDTRVLLAIL